MNDPAIIVGLFLIFGIVLMLGIALVRANQRNRQLVSGINQISGNFSLWDEQGRLVLFNQRFADDLGNAVGAVPPGSTFEHYIRTRVENGLVPESRDDAEGWIEQRLEHYRKPAGAFEIRMGEDSWNLVSERRTNQGGVVIYGVDISALKAAQKTAFESEQKFRDFASSAADWFWETDADHRFSYVSENIQRLTGMRPGDIIGKRRDQTAETSDDPALWATHNDTIGRREPFREFTIRRRIADGPFLWTAISGVPHFAPDGQFAGYRGVGRNVTELVTARQALEGSEAKARQLAHSAQEDRIAAEAADSAKSEFLASMSHEFRTPLNAILGFGQLLTLEGQNTLSATQREYLAMIMQSGDHLLSLINEILDLASIEAGQLRMSMTALDPQDIAQDVVKTMQPVAAKADIKLNFDARVLEQRIKADPKRLKQILLNLVSNAIKYNKPNGTVDVTLSEADGIIRISIEDTGNGIAEELHSQIFAPFNRLGAERSGIEGAGIGLALCKRLVTMMGGEIGADSVLGAGSTFWVTFPAEPALESSLSQPRVAS